mmetsp:Transcript_121993/g.352434  ORF Transcript_121993/g.352434 Transcript_121993/m.352434 type:complete len:208 (+) Transcript_121993:319-942(+)
MHLRGGVGPLAKPVAVVALELQRGVWLAIFRVAAHHAIQVRAHRRCHRGVEVPGPRVSGDEDLGVRPCARQGEGEVLGALDVDSEGGRQQGAIERLQVLRVGSQPGELDRLLLRDQLRKAEAGTSVRVGGEEHVEEVPEVCRRRMLLRQQQNLRPQLLHGQVHVPRVVHRRLQVGQGPDRHPALCQRLRLLGGQGRGVLPGHRQPIG